VYADTKEAQEPWHNTSLRSEVFLVAPEVNLKADAEATAPAQQNTDIAVEWNAIKDSTSIAAVDAFIAAHGDNAVFLALAQDRKSALQGESTTALLDSLMIKKNVDAAPDPKPQTRGAMEISLDGFLDAAKSANDGNSIFALLGPPTVKLLKPGKNPASKTPAATLTQRARAATLDVLLGEQGDLKFSEENTTHCRLDWIDRCPFLPKSLTDSLAAAMAAKGMDISFHNGNYFQVSRLVGSKAYVVSNNPQFGNGDVAIVAAIVNENAEVLQIYGFDLSRQTLGVEGGDAASDILVTGAALDGDDLYFSFDTSYRCTTSPRKFGFIAKFSQIDRDVKWVSPFNVSDTNFILNGNEILSANGGSCSDDFLYRLNKQTGKITQRAKMPTAIERMDVQNADIIMQLYEGAGVYQLQ
jgi:hypothetical protein